MGRMLGSYDSDELDRPDLNKCPDCGCFFSQDECPLCGKPCPEEMRAGNRKAVKTKKTRGNSGRVTFINWYHSWWFIALMFFIFPVVSIVLVVTSPYKNKTKAIVASILAVLAILSYIGTGTIISRLINMWDKPVDTSLSRDESIDVCDEVDAEKFYRMPDEYKDKFVCLDLVVIEKISEYDDIYSSSEYGEYYVCTPVDKPKMVIFVRDCIVSGASNFAAGDLITVYGEGDGEFTLYYGENYDPNTSAIVNAAYVVLNVPDGK